MPIRHLSWEHYYQDKVSRHLRTTCSELLYMNMTYLRQTLLSSGTDKGELLLNIDLFTMVNKTTCNRVYKSELLLNIDLQLTLVVSNSVDSNFRLSRIRMSRNFGCLA